MPNIVCSRSFNRSYSTCLRAFSTSLDFCFSKSSALPGKLSEPAGRLLSFDFAFTIVLRELGASEDFSEYFDELLLDEAPDSDCLEDRAIGEVQGCFC